MRRLDLPDIDACLVLSDAAGWNQTEADWALFLTSGEGMGLFDAGRLVATAATLPFGAFGWISMVLVAEDARRRGHASRLMGWAIEAHRAASRVPGLDATVAGREVYRRLGFKGVCAITRLQRPAGGSPAPSPDAVRPATAADLADIIAYDTPRFGAERGALLTGLLARSAAFAAVARVDGRITGFLLGRDGRRAPQIGPVLAETPADAIALLSHALGRVEGPVFIDLMDGQSEVAVFLAGKGFVPQRSFERMVLTDGPPPQLDHPAIVAIGGPELA